MFGIDTSWLAALLIGIITFYVVQYYVNVRKYPPGPFTLPGIGNLLIFLKRKGNASVVFDELAKKYDGIFTLWVGSMPFVFVANWQLCKEGLITKRNDVISRPLFNSFRHSLKHTDAIVFHGNTKHWEVCRKVGYSAVRKFSDSKALANIVYQNMQDMVNDMLAKKGSFNPTVIVQNTIFHVIAQTAFGMEKLEESDLDIFRLNQALFHETMLIDPSELFPILSPFLKHIDVKYEKGARLLGDIFTKKFQEAKKIYNSEELNSFADSVIWSKNEADEKDSVNKQYLTDDNMKKILSDLFLAGTDTTTITLQWVLLAMGQFPEIQDRMREEILQNIGKRMPEQEDRLNCPYTWAFITEILRLRAPVPMMLPHATSVDTELGGRKIPKGTTVIFNCNPTHFDPTLWEEPEKLKPERFLDADGKYSTSRLQGYLAFGEGKRNCIGEKMARNDLFLAIAAILQKIKIEIDGDDESRAKLEITDHPLFSLPKDYNIKVHAIPA